MQAPGSAKRSSLHFKDVEEMIRAEASKQPQATIQNGLSEIIQAVGLNILKNFSLEQIEKLERECKENPPKLANLNGLVVFGAAVGLVDGLVPEKRKMVSFEKIARPCVEGNLDLALHYTRALSPESDIREPAYHLLIDIYLIKGDAQRAALLARELQQPGVFV